MNDLSGRGAADEHGPSAADPDRGARRRTQFIARGDRDRPPSVTYCATGLGRGAVGAIEPFLDWIRANADEITAHWPAAQSVR